MLQSPLECQWCMLYTVFRSDLGLYHFYIKFQGRITIFVVLISHSPIDLNDRRSALHFFPESLAFKKCFSLKSKINKHFQNYGVTIFRCCRERDPRGVLSCYTVACNYISHAIDKTIWHMDNCKLRLQYFCYKN